MNVKVNKYLNELYEYIKPDELNEIIDISPTIILLNLPIVDNVKKDRLIAVLSSKVLNKFGNFYQESLYMPFGDNNSSKGYFYHYLYKIEYYLLLILILKKLKQL